MPVSAFGQVTPLLAQVCQSLEPFEVQLTCFDLFIHSRQNATLYLVPEPAGAIKVLQKKLLDLVPQYDDVSIAAG